MSLFNNIKQMLGLSESESDMDMRPQESERTSYINPFKEEQSEIHTDTAGKTENFPQPPVQAQAASPCENINQDIIGKIIGVLNISIPEYVKKYIDKEAQTKYVENLIGDDLRKYTDSIKSFYEEAARMEWQAERMEMGKKLAASVKKSEDATAKNEELRGRIMSLERQKSTLNERNSLLESKAETAEAEKEQYQLECKSLMNKLKVSTVNEDEISRLKEENGSLSADLTNMRAELLKLKNEMLGYDKEAIGKSKQTIDNLTAANSILSSKVDELQAIVGDAAEKNQTIKTLQEEISLQQQELTLLKGKEAAFEQAAKERESADNLKQSLTAKENELNDLRKTIQQQNDEIYALTERLNKSEDYDKLSEDIEQLKSEIELKNVQIQDLTQANKEMASISEQLKSAIDSNKRLHSNTEQKLRQEIEVLQKENERMANEQKQYKADRKSADLSLHKEKPSKKEPAQQKISAIDYSTEYTDWLMPTPPSASIPIDSDENEEQEEKARSDKQKKNPNAPSQMELFA